MSDTFVLSCCSSCDLTPEFLEELNVQYVPFHFSVDGTDYPDVFGKSLSQEELYRRMENGAEVKTAQVAVGEYIDYFTPFLENGMDILHLTLSTGISGTYNGAVSAANILSQDYPDRKIYIVDSLAASSGFGLFVALLAELKKDGMGIDELKETAEAMRHRVNHLFFTTDLTYFIKGGRVSKTEGLIGNLLNICPLLCVDPEGKLVPVLKARGKKQVIAKIVKEMESRAENGNDYTGKVYISHSRCQEDAETVAALVEEKFPKMEGKVKIFPIGTTIGSHTGPGTVALFFMGGEDRVV